MNLELILGIVLMVLAAVVSVLILLQSGKEKKLSSTITGSADTFFSKGKGQTKDKMLSRITTILAVVFCLLVFATVIVITVIVL